MKAQFLFQGMGTAENPYLIHNEEELSALAETLNNHPEGYKECIDKHFLLTADIKLKKDWTPIGHRFEGYTTITQKYAGGFCGIFDGGGHLISNMNVKVENIHYTGLFGLVQGTIRNVGVEGKISVKGGAAHIGGIAGLMHQGLLENCYTNIKIEGTGLNEYPEAGGLLGRSQYSPIKNCYTRGSISMKGGQPTVGCVAGDDQPVIVVYWSKDMKLEARDSDNKELSIRISGTGVDHKVMTSTTMKVNGTDKTILELLNAQVSGAMIRWTQKDGQYPEFAK